MTEDQRNKISFKEFLDQNTNLITIFGVLNALFIYSTTINSNYAKGFLLPAFFILSLLVWLEIVLFALKSNDGTFKYELFFFIACLIELGLIIYFVTIFSSLLFSLLVLVIWFGLTYFLSISLVKLFSKWLKARSQKVKNFLLGVIFICSFILSGLTLLVTKSFWKQLASKTLIEKKL